MRAVMATVMAAYFWAEMLMLASPDRSLLWSHHHRVFLCFIVFITWPLLIIHTSECKHDRQKSMDSVMCWGGKKKGARLIHTESMQI